MSQSQTSLGSTRQWHCGLSAHTQGRLSIELGGPMTQYKAAPGLEGEAMVRKPEVAEMEILPSAKVLHMQVSCPPLASGIPQ